MYAFRTYFFLNSHHNDVWIYLKEKSTVDIDDSILLTVMFSTFYSYINERNRKRNIVEAEKAAAVSLTIFFHCILLPFLLTSLWPSDLADGDCMILIIHSQSSFKR